MKTWARKNTMEVVSQSLQYDIQTQLVGRWLRHFDFLECLPPRYIGRIGQITETCFYAPGDAVFLDGDAATEMYIVVKGTVLEVFSHHEDQSVHERDTEVRHAGDIMGQNCLFIQETRTSTAVSSLHCEMLSIRRDKFQAQCRSHQELLLYYLATAAFLALTSAQTETLRACLSQGLPANFTDLRGRTLLIEAVLAACRGLADEKKLLNVVEVGAVAEVADANVDAAAPNEIAEPEELIEAVDKYKVARTKSLRPPAEGANVVKLLLASEADVNAIEPATGSTPTHIACRAGNRELTSMLLKQGANIFVADKNAQTVMDAAWASGNDDLIALMKLVDLTTSAKEGKTADVRNALAEGVNPNWIHPKSGHTPLHAASEKGELEILQLLLAHKADANFGTKDTFSPLHAACAKGHEEVARKLLEYKANVNHAAGSVTPLGMAVQKGNVAFTRMLCQESADVTQVDNKGLSLLHVAVKKAKADVVQVLLDFAADPEHQDEKGVTPLELAKQNKKAAAIIPLLQAAQGLVLQIGPTETRAAA